MTASDCLETLPDRLRLRLALGSGDSVPLTAEDLRILMGRWDTMESQIRLQARSFLDRALLAASDPYYPPQKEP